jgi:hypothetical protein
MRLELDTANRLLQALDGTSERTFAYPCSNLILGRRGLAKSVLFKLGFEFTRLPGLVDRMHLVLGSTQKSYRPVVGGLFAAARGGGLTRQSPIPPLEQFDRFCLASVAIEGWTCEELIQYAQRGLSDGRWVILQVHGVGGGHRMDCEKTVFRDFVAWLGDHHADRIMTVLEGARRVWNLPPRSEKVTETVRRTEESSA